ncbi:hypothetical protein C475_03339 [Halosimplex carlsbadense 2-9-1]|uniref:Uncharacterized protein n=1 Tax=Halosimplex carlsbadense 2-9-1 TaxID=797114 RepID=M0D2Y8_9EURY|nr:hypothetical protein C475_03339 [Halosimplex carlsbadense 2-9-1]
MYAHVVELTGLLYVGFGLYVAYVARAIAARLGTGVEGRGSSGADVAAVRLAGGAVAIWGVYVLITG